MNHPDTLRLVQHIPNIITAACNQYGIYETFYSFFQTQLEQTSVPVLASSAVAPL